MQQSKDVSFNFDHLSRLYKLDPDAFEHARKKIIEQEISKYPPEVQTKLKKYQWVLDMKRKKCKNPLEACFMFYNMLMDQVYGENGLLENLLELIEVANSIKETGKIPSFAENKRNINTTIIPFNPKVRKIETRKKLHKKSSL